MSWPDYALVSFFAALMSWDWWRDRTRSAEIRALADSCGFYFIGKSLPDSVPAARLPRSPTSVWNVIDGDVRGVRVVAFDCRFGYRRGSWKRTVIAFGGKQNRPPASLFNTDITKEYVDDWLFLYHPKQVRFFPDGLMPITEIRAYIESVPATMIHQVHAGRDSNIGP